MVNQLRETKASDKCIFRRFCFGAMVLFSSQSFAASLKGTVVLTGKGADKVNLEDTIIFFEPDKKAKVIPLADPHKIVMKKKSYQPRVSVIPVGTTVQISNYDSILHNAFSPSKPNQFDLGLYGKSEGKLHRFEHAGVVRIFCNVHFHMVAYALVLDTPYYTQANENGEFELNGIPEVSGRLIFWHERTKRVVKKISLPVNQAQNIEMVISKRRVPEHNNKSGASYKKKKRRSRRKYN